eukprot:11880861-Prorocentrum_lima.AAC.1
MEGRCTVRRQGDDVSACRDPAGEGTSDRALAGRLMGGPRRSRSDWHQHECKAEDVRHPASNGN